MLVDRGSPKITVLIVEGDRAVREGLETLLARQADLQVAGCVGDIPAALRELAGTNPAVVVVDPRSPGGDEVALCREIAERRLRTQVVVLSADLDEDTVRAALLAGARAYVVKDLDSDELPRAIRAAARRETTIDPKVTEPVIAAALGPDAGRSALRPREHRLLRLMAEGMSMACIAEHLGLSRRALSAAQKQLYRKLGAGSRADAVAAGVRRGLL